MSGKLTLALTVAFLQQRSLLRKHMPPPLNFLEAEVRSPQMHMNTGRLISVSVAFSSSYVSLKPTTALSLFSP